jgi:hypothetical protein
MEKGKKAEIKKLMEQIHKNPTGAPGSNKGSVPNQGLKGKGSKGAKNASTYRPKI